MTRIGFVCDIDSLQISCRFTTEKMLIFNLIYIYIYIYIYYIYDLGNLCSFIAERCGKPAGDDFSIKLKFPFSVQALYQYAS